MGFYIQTSSNKGKADEIANTYDGVIWTPLTPPDYHIMTEGGKGIIVVIDNGPFEAAGFAFDEQEYESFKREDGRPRQYVIIRREDAEKASGYRR